MVLNIMHDDWDGGIIVCGTVKYFFKRVKRFTKLKATTTNC